MTIRTDGSIALRGILLTTTALVGVVASSAAHAVCSPPAASNVVATCTGATVNQDFFVGYGSLLANNFSVTVVPGASVTGGDGVVTGLNSSVMNYGTITATTQDGVRTLNGSTITNFGTITSGQTGVFGGIYTLTNSGTITAPFAISAQTVTLTNSGAITSTTGNGVSASQTSSVNNSGTISGIGFAIAMPNGSVTNSGTISATGAGATVGIFGYSSGTLNVTNSGAITTNGYGVYGSAVTLNNTGTINAAADGVASISSSGALTVTNSGTIQSTSGGGYNGIYGAGVANITNSGTIQATGSFGFGVYTIGNTTLVNSGTIQGNSGNGYGVYSFANLNANNSGTISGDAGISAATLTMTNSGTVNGKTLAIGSNGVMNLTNSGVINSTTFAVITAGGGTITNSGIISGGANSDAINHGPQVNLTNTGTITGGRYGVGAQNAVNNIVANNSGTISGGVVGLRANGFGNVTNSGTISGGSGTAIQFGATGGPASDTLTVQYGARFGGLVDFGFGADTVNFAKGSWILDVAKFNAAASTINTMGNPYFVTPNQIIVVDNSNFAALNRAVMDITGWIASVLPDTPRPVAGPSGGSAPAALAPVDSMETRFADVFDAFPRDALGYAKAPVFKAAAANYADGSTVWAKGFGGRREQTGSAAILGNITTGYGGAIGYERAVAPNVRAGALVGASTNRTEMAANQGSTDTDVFFGGLYARYMPGATFLDLAVIGGMLDNSGARNIFGPLAVQTARADYNGWFVNPQTTLGHAFALDANSATTLTPAVKARYVGAHFDGYTETGSTVNLAVGARDLHAFEERGQLTLAAVRDFGSWSRIAMHLTGGVLAQQRSGGATVSLGLFGQNILAATPDKANTAGVFGATGFDWQIGNLMVFSAAEFTATDDSNRTVSAKGGVRYVW